MTCYVIKAPKAEINAGHMEQVLDEVMDSSTTNEDFSSLMEVKQAEYVS